MPCWASTVVAGKARLGGISVVVIAVETRIVEIIHPGDPANLDLKATLIPQAGQVWFPDSSSRLLKR